MKQSSKFKNLIHILVSTYFTAIGFFVILETIFTRLHGSVRIEHVYNFEHVSRTLTLVIGLVIIYLSRQLFRFRRNAFIVAIFSLIALILLNLFRLHHHWQVFGYLIALPLLLWDRESYRVKSDNVSLRQGLINSIIIITATLAYATLGFYFIESRHFGQEFSLWQSFLAALNQLLTFQGHAFVPHTRHAAWFLNSVDIAGTVALILTLTSLFKPLRFLFQSPEQDIAEAKNILEQYSDSTEDFFKLWPQDKHYFFSEKNDAFLAYKVSGGIALILDGPSGEKTSFKKLLMSFHDFAFENGWSTAIIHSDENTSALAKKMGYNMLCIGNEAIIDVATFATQTARNKHFRYLMNKASRENLSFELWLPPLSDDQIKGLRKISRDWESQGGRREYTFSMAPFSGEYLRQSTIAVTMQEEKPIAYCNLIPVFVKNARTIDHMRSIPNKTSVAMHFLLVKLIERLHSESIEYFNLGFSPLSRIETKEDNTFVEKTLLITKKLTNFFFASSGLENFKNQYKPDWRPRYICYEKGLPNLLRTALALNKAMQVPRKSLGNKWFIIFSVIAGLFYSSFFLALVLNPAKFNMGMVSTLGIKGQPYAWLFNLMDIIVGIIVIFATRLLWQRIKPRNILRKISIFAFGLSGFGTLLAAILAMPHKSYRGLERFAGRELFLHNLASFIGEGALVVSAVIFSLYSWKRNRDRSLINIYSIVFVLSGIFSVISSIFGEQDLTQRIFIVLSSGWMIYFISYLALKER